MFLKLLNSNILFIILCGIFILVTAIVLYQRDGKDLKVGLYAIAQVSQNKSPYENPTDPQRPIFRYAPGVTILEHPFFLRTKIVGPYKLEDTRYSIYAWFSAEMLALMGIAWFLFKLMPAVSTSISLRNMKLGFVMALPLIIYEVINSQNKLIALFFMFAAIYLFEHRKYFWSGLCFNIALTIYVALLPFLFLFLIKDKKYIISFIVTLLIVFMVVPSLIFGFDLNTYLLKEWWRSLHSFMNTNSYATYADLRRSSQSIPSVIGRIFVSGHSGHFSDFISPIVIHLIIRTISFIVFLVTCAAVWKNPDDKMRGISYVVFLILALILPQYCVYYTWAYLFVFNVAVLNYVSHPDIPRHQKRDLLVLMGVLCVASYTIVFHVFSYFSVLFWATFIFWTGMIATLWGRPHLLGKTDVVTKG